MSSPLIYQIILNEILSQIEINKPIPEFLPFKQSYLDVEALLKGAIPLFSNSIMRNAVYTDFKKNECFGDVKLGEFVPKESVYHTELLHAILKVTIKLSITLF